MSGELLVSFEKKILGAIRKLFVDDVNKLLEELSFHVPTLEFGTHGGREVIIPNVSLSACEQSEKERIVFVNAYAVEISLPVDDLRDWDGELLAFAYGAAVRRAVRLNSSLDGIVDRTVITNMDYVEPKRRFCGDRWIVAARLRVTVEVLANDG